MKVDPRGLWQRFLQVSGETAILTRSARIGVRFSIGGIPRKRINCGLGLGYTVGINDEKADWPEMITMGIAKKERQTSVKGCSEKEYLDFERSSEERHEYQDGEIIAMANENVPHGNTVRHSI